MEGIRKLVKLANDAGSTCDGGPVTEENLPRFFEALLARAKKSQEEIAFKTEYIRRYTT